MCSQPCTIIKICFPDSTGFNCSQNRSFTCLVSFSQQSELLVCLMLSALQYLAFHIFSDPFIIQNLCSMCTLSFSRSEESVFHMFYECCNTIKIWISCSVTPVLQSEFLLKSLLEGEFVHTNTLLIYVAYSCSLPSRSYSGILATLQYSISSYDILYTSFVLIIITHC